MHTLRLPSDDPASMQRPISFPEFNCQSTYVPGTYLADVLLYQVAVPTSDEEQSEQEPTTLWPAQPSGESQYKATTQISDEEWDNQMATDEVPRLLL